MFLFATFGVTWSISWSRFGAHWILKGSKHPFFFVGWEIQYKMRKMMSKKGGLKNIFLCLISMPKWETRNCNKEVFALYVLQFKRFRWSGKLIENGSPNDGNKSSKWKPWASEVWLFWDFDGFWQSCFVDVFGCWQKAGPKTQKSGLLAKCWIQIIIQIETLSSGSGQTLHYYIWQRLTPTGIGGFWRPLDFEGASKVFSFFFK